VYPHQIERLTGVLLRAGLGALVATSPDNVLYLSGFSGCDEDVGDGRTFAVFTPGATALIVPARDVPSVIAEAVDVDHVVCHGELTAVFPERQTPEVQRIREIVSATASSPADALVTALGLIGIRGESIGLDEARLGRAAWQGLVGQLPGTDTVPAAGPLAEARRIKSPYEIECLDRALRVAEESLDAVIQALERGMTERDATILFSGEVVKRGASPLRAVVVMGDRTWIPAPLPTDRALRPGDLVRFDVGVRYRGYCASVARTAVFGEPAPEAERAYLALQASLEAASDAARPAASAGHIVETAARVAQAEGLSADSCRLSGHGIGLVSRERPEIARGGLAIIEAGEVLCIEAPYYDIGSMGLAIRDTLLITSAGARAMNRSRHDLVVLD